MISGLLVILCLFFNGIAYASLDAEYSKNFTDLLEFVYGSEFLSQGGKASVDLMFAGILLDDKKVLDIGSGIGGVDFYLAEKYKVALIGIDCVERLIEDAKDRQKEHSLKGTIEFLHLEENNFNYPFVDNSFDIVFSKESILHVWDKFSLLKEVFRILKPGGQLIILDWVVDAPELGTHIKQMMAVDELDLKMIKTKEYEDYLQRVGFKNLCTSPLNDRYVSYTNDNIEKIRSQKDDLITLFGNYAFDYCLLSWQLQKRIFENNEVIILLLKAIKPNLDLKYIAEPIDCKLNKKSGAGVIVRISHAVLSDQADYIFW